MATKRARVGVNVYKDEFATVADKIGCKPEEVTTKKIREYLGLKTNAKGTSVLSQVRKGVRENLSALPEDKQAEILKILGVSSVETKKKKK